MSDCYLIDTHVVLWWANEPERLSDRSKKIIEDPSVDVYLSVASIWEMRIKQSIGRLTFPMRLLEIIERERIVMLNITTPHALAVGDLPLHHRDPFDRLIIAQARVENMTLISSDADIARYEVQCQPA